MGRVWEYLSWGFLLTFLVPTTLIVASWNSLPGDSLYGVKLGLEQALLFVAQPSYAASGSLHVKYTERRFTEAKKLLSDRHSVEGLDYLERQVTTTKAVIDQAPNQTAQKQLAQAYINTLREVSAELGQEQEALAQAPRPATTTTTQTTTTTTTTTTTRRQTSYQAPTAPALPTGQATPIFSPPRPTPLASPTTVAAPGQISPPPLLPTAAPTSKPPLITSPAPTSPPPIVTPPPADVSSEISQTQDQIEQTIEDLERVVQGIQGGRGEGDEHRNESENRGQEQREGGREKKDDEKRGNREDKVRGVSISTYQGVVDRLRILLYSMRQSLLGR